MRRRHGIHPFQHMCAIELEAAGSWRCQLSFNLFSIFHASSARVSGCSFETLWLPNVAAQSVSRKRPMPPLPRNPFRVKSALDRNFPPFSKPALRII